MKKGIPSFIGGLILVVFFSQAAFAETVKDRAIGLWKAEINTKFKVGKIGKIKSTTQGSMDITEDELFSFIINEVTFGGLFEISKNGKKIRYYLNNTAYELFEEILYAKFGELADKKGCSFSDVQISVDDVRIPKIKKAWKFNKFKIKVKGKVVLANEKNIQKTFNFKYILKVKLTEKVTIIDSDGDGVADDDDECPDTPEGVTVDETGCPLDSDGDGVPDYLDECPDTQPTCEVDEKGCPLDSDGDGIPDCIDSVNIIASNAHSVSLAIDSDSNIHITYHDIDTMNLIYATNASGEWIRKIINTGNDFNSSAHSIAIDAYGHIHIAYVVGTYNNNYHDNLVYLTNASGSWKSKILDVAYAHKVSLAIDSFNNVHIVYAETNNPISLKYATNVSGSWVIETVEQAEDENATTIGLYSSMALDSNGMVHISYVHQSGQEFVLKYATNASGSWVSKIIDDSDSGMGFGNSIVTDSLNFVHISYNDWHGNLRYATNASGEWIHETIDSAVNICDDTSIAVDSYNNIHIAYGSSLTSEWGNLALKYATNSSSSWKPVVIDESGDVGIYTSLVIDSSDKLHLAYEDDLNNLIRYMHWQIN